METTKQNIQQHRNLTLADERLVLLDTIKEMVKMELNRKIKELKDLPYKSSSHDTFIKKNVRGNTDNK